jgi:hypothetical protein
VRGQGRRQQCGGQGQSWSFGHSSHSEFSPPDWWFFMA